MKQGVSGRGTYTRADVRLLSCLAMHETYLARGSSTCFVILLKQANAASQTPMGCIRYHAAATVDSIYFFSFHSNTDWYELQLIHRARVRDYFRRSPTTANGLGECRRTATLARSLGCSWARIARRRRAGAGEYSGSRAHSGGNGPQLYIQTFLSSLPLPLRSDSGVSNARNNPGEDHALIVLIGVSCPIIIVLLRQASSSCLLALPCQPSLRTCPPPVDRQTDRQDKVYHLLGRPVRCPPTGQEGMICCQIELRNVEGRVTLRSSSDGSSLSRALTRTRRLGWIMSRV